jgi:hypothetical protein
MAFEPKLELTQVTPFRRLNDVDCAIWSYSLSWSTTETSWSFLRHETTSNFGARVALKLSHHLDIHSPAEFPEVHEIQETSLEKPAAGAVQYLIRAFKAEPSPPILFRFVAPIAKEEFSAVQLVHKLTAEAAWSDLPFKISSEGDIAFQQVMPAPAVVCPPHPGASNGILLSSATRQIEKATLVPLQIDSTSDAGEEGGALLKFGFVRQLGLSSGEVAAVQNHRAQTTRTTQPLAPASGIWDLLRQFEGTPMPSRLPSATSFYSVPFSELAAFGAALVDLRQQAVEQVQRQTGQIAHPRERTLSQSAPPDDVGRRLLALHVATVAAQSFNFGSGQAPVGMLNLERLEMTPAGIERGELVATIPLAPLEETAVTHKEWSVTSKEFTSIVTDSLENVSETGVTDNTELTQTTTSQEQHANQFNITSTAAGGIPIIHGSATATFGAQDGSSQSATDSRKQASTITRKASSRAKQEHKVTISTTTVSGTSETSTRILKNPSATTPIRIDYFSMMRKWHVGLYRYGLRLTYDIVIPEPGGTLREDYAQLADLQSHLGSFKFVESHDSITEQNYQQLADKYGAQVPIPPSSSLPDIFVHAQPGNTPQDAVSIVDLPQIQVPDGYSISELHLSFHFETPTGDHKGKFSILGSTFDTGPRDQMDFPKDTVPGHPDDLTRPENGNFMLHANGSLVISCRLENTTNNSISVRAVVHRTDAALAQWKNDVWNALYNAAQTQYYAQQQEITGEITQLQDQLGNVDTLTLRREEGDEIMKGALRFLLGYGFEFVPPEVEAAFKAASIDITHGVGFTGNVLMLDPGQLAVVRQYEDRVRFINEAIEWENAVWFLYSYFWDLPDSWDFIRQIKGPDATRQAFLRAGSARVVLTIRKGWEDRWVRFVDTGDPGGITNSPYLTMAQEIAAYDDRNYPGIPPANPGKTAVRLEDAVITSSTTPLTPPPGLLLTEVPITVASAEGLLVGAQVVIDSRVDTDTTNLFGKQEQTTITAITGNVLTLAQIQNGHGGGGGAYMVLQPGTKGALIAEWFEYIPTSGTDIQVTSNLATIA